jgi:spore coat polysaccharide biosynthesis protein SpsF
MEFRFVGVIQARMGSSRFPGKMMSNLSGFTLFEWVVRRVKESLLLDEVWLATSDRKENDDLEAIAKDHGFSVLRGDEEDVLSRFFAIKDRTTGSHFVRVCADNPLICPWEIDRVIRFSKEKPECYAFNHIPAMDNNYIDGAGAEVLPASYLEVIELARTTNEQKEHASKYIWDNPDNFELATIPAPRGLAYPEISLDVDTESDLHDLELQVSKYESWDAPENLVLSEFLEGVTGGE